MSARHELDGNSAWGAGEEEAMPVPLMDVVELLHRAPAAAHALVHEVGCRARALSRARGERTTIPAEMRIPRLLLELTRRSGMERPGEGTWVAEPLSVQDVADLCGTSPALAIRVLSRLRLHGIVRSGPGGFLVQDRHRLEGLALGAH